MDPAEFRRALEEAGLSKYQAEVYSTLLRLGSASATEIADACTVPTPRIYDVLRDLETKDYIETYEQDNLHARARDPEGVLTDLRGQAARLADAADEIEDQWEQPSLDDHKVSIVKRFETVFEQSQNLIRAARNEVQVAGTPEQVEELRPALAAAYDDGVIVKIAIHTGIADEGELPDGSAYEGIATEVRFRELPTPFVTIVDRTKTCFAPHARSLNVYGVLVDDYTLTYVFHWYFQTSLWEVWEVIHNARSETPPREYANLRQCVRFIEPLLSDGWTVHAKINGQSTETKEATTLEGRVTDVIYSGTQRPDGETPLCQLAGQVTIVIETDDGAYTVGGWGAVIEDVEATRISVEWSAPDDSTTEPARDGSEAIH